MRPAQSLGTRTAVPVCPDRFVPALKGLSPLGWVRHEGARYEWLRRLEDRLMTKT